MQVEVVMIYFPQNKSITNFRKRAETFDTTKGVAVTLGTTKGEAATLGETKGA